MNLKDDLRNDIVDRKFWTTKFGASGESFALCRDHLRPGDSELRELHFEVPAEGSSALNRLTAGNSDLLRSVLIAATAVAAAAMTDVEDTTIMVSPTEGVRGLPNRFLPLQVRAGAEMTLRDVLGSSRSVFVEANRHAGFPIGTFLSENNITPTDFMVSLGGELDHNDLAAAGVHFLVQLNTTEGGTLIYNSSLFSSWTAQRLIENLLDVIRLLTMETLDETVHDLTSIRDADRSKIFGDFNATDADLPTERVLHSFLEEQASRHPERIAIANTRMTYGELNSRTNGLARTLREKGVGPGSIVGVCLRRSELSLLAIYAILKAGGAYLPIDPTLPADRIRYILDHSKTALTLSVPEDSGALGQVPMLDLEDPLLWAGAGDNLDQLAGPADACYVIYTSGSTGRPKGVVVEHRAIVNRLAWMQQEFQLSTSDVILHKTPFTFDVSVWEIFWWSMAGASVATLPSGEERDPEQIAEAVRAYGVTTLHFVPSMLSAFLHYASDIFRDADLVSLRYVFASGEALSVNNVQTLHKTLPQTSLINLYGPTEAAVDVSYHNCEVMDATRSVPIGRPISNIKLLVRLKDGGLAPLGVPGELCIAGVGLARGYLHADELTAERFVIGDEGIGRLYRTGDLARWLPNGVIEYLGRIDTQVKVRGYRIELSEIEYVAQEVLGISGAAATALTTDGKEPQLCLYVVCESDLSHEALNDKLSEKLPSYMVPQYIISVPEIPTNHNGKRDLSSLVRPNEQGAVAEFREPESETEKLVASVWQTILTVERVSQHDSFFAMGGDSILAIRVVAALKREGFNVTVSDVFANPRLEDFAGKIERFVVAQVQADTSERAFWPSTALQNGMIFHSMRNPESPVYHDVFQFHINTPEVDLSAIGKVCQILQNRHPVLRARFDLSTFDVPHMVILDRVSPPLEIQNISGSDDQHETLLAWTEAEKLAPIDLAAGPAYRICVFVTSDRTFTLGLSFHHALFDGWSVATLVEEWVEVYESVLNGGFMPEIASVNFQQMAAELESVSLIDSGDLSFWRAEMADMMLSPVPQLASRDDSQRPGTVRELSRSLDKGLIERLEQSARDSHVPLKTLFLAAYLRVQSLITNEPDVVVGLVTNGRPEVGDAERAIGMFLNTVPMRTTVPTGKTWRHLIEMCFANELKIQDHRRFPLPAIQRMVGGRAAYEVIFNYTNFHVHSEVSKPHRTEVSHVDYFEQTDASLVSYAGRDPYRGVWACRFAYDPGLYSAEQIERYLGYFQRALEALADEVDEPIRNTPLIGEAEARMLIPAIERPHDRSGIQFGTLIERFNSMVSLHGERTATSCGDRELTYRQLDQKSDEVAAELARRGVGAGDFVCLALDRGLEMVISLLAVLKLGAAYVPIDPQYPEERIIATVDDSKPKLVIASPNLGHIFGSVPVLTGTEAEFDSIANLPWQKSEELVGGPESAAYVIYTSGSTGKPKGVVVSNESVLRLFSATDEWFKFTEQDVWALYHSFAFDFSVWELWGALLHGAEVVVVPYWASRSMPEFADLIATKRVTMLSQTPSAFTQLSPELAKIAQSGSHLALRTVVFGGEALDYSALRTWFSVFNDESPQLINMYGITETTVHVTYRRVRSEDVRSPRSLIGTPIPDLSVCIVDSGCVPVPLGTPGEILVGGAGLAREYLNRPEETAQRFVEVDLGLGLQRAYRSGDLARRLASGDIEYLGRNDNQVKIQGYRIELGDIESAVSTHAEIISGKALALQRPDGSKFLALYALKLPRATIDVSELREYMSDRLPRYMVPNFIMLLDEWPLTINGKIDIKALPNPQIAADLVQDRIQPRTQLEASVAQVWAAVLGLPAVGIDDSYYALGGDSLQGIRLIGALQRKGIRLALDDLFRMQTIRRLSDESLFTRLQSDEPIGVAAPFSMISAQDAEQVPEGIIDAYPMTDLQQGMIYHSDIDIQQGAFHDVIRYRIALPFSERILREGLTEMIEQHEILRTSMNTYGFSVPMQLVHSKGRLDLDVTDISGRTADEQIEWSDARFEAEKSTNFVWTQPTLMRFLVQELEHDEFYLCVSFHHSIIDGWSFSNVISRFLENYRRSLTDLPKISVPEEPFLYADYVGQVLNAQKDEASATFWKNKLEGMSLPKLPGSSPAGDRWSEKSIVLPSGVVTELERTAKRQQVSLRHVCQAIHFKALSLISGVDDVVSGVFTNGRPEHEDADRMVGLFLNILPQRVSVGNDFQTLVAETARLDHEMLTHRRYSYASIQKSTLTRRLVNTAFNFVNFSAYTENLGVDGGSTITDIKWFEHSDFSLLVTFNAVPFADQLNISFNTDGRQVDAFALEKIVRIYEIIAESCANFEGRQDELDDILLNLQEINRREVLAGEPQKLELLPYGVNRDEMREYVSGLCSVEEHALDSLRPDSLTSLRIAQGIIHNYGVKLELIDILRRPVGDWLGQV